MFCQIRNAKRLLRAADMAKIGLLKGIHISKFIIGKETLKVLINFVTLFESSYLQYLDRRR